MLPVDYKEDRQDMELLEVTQERQAPEDLTDHSPKEPQRVMPTYCHPTAALKRKQDKSSDVSAPMSVPSMPSGAGPPTLASSLFDSRDSSPTSIPSLHGRFNHPLLQHTPCTASTYGHQDQPCAQSMNNYEVYTKLKAQHWPEHIVNEDGEDDDEDDDCEANCHRHQVQPMKGILRPARFHLITEKDGNSEPDGRGLLPPGLWLGQ